MTVTKTAVLDKLRTKALEMTRLVQVMATAKDLSDWADAETHLARLMEVSGDIADAVEPADIGFDQGGYRKVQTTAELLAKYEQEVTA